MDDLTWRRKLQNIRPMHIEEVLGQFPVKDIKEDAIIRWSMIK